jgi:hypothetical protein
MAPRHADFRPDEGLRFGTVHTLRPTVVNGRHGKEPLKAAPCVD